MDLTEYIGQKVLNKRNEIGVIKEVNNDFITVEYPTRAAQYEPSVLQKGLLTFEDKDVASAFKIKKVKLDNQKELIEINECLKELDELIGLDEIKQQVSDLICELKIYKYRLAFNLKIPNVTRHMIFVGNPGTGKTTVARIIAKIYKAIGLLSKGHLVETDRSGLVAGYEGQTALKTKEVINSSLGGVLFIDEAYSLVISKNDSYGREAIDALTKEIEDHRDDLIVILAGYEKEMNDFISSNSGLTSRFNKVISFTDYCGEELFSIFKKLFTSNDYILSNDAEMYAQDYFNNIKTIAGNGRAIRNLFEAIIKFQSRRVSSLKNINKDDLMYVKPCDLQNALN